MTFYKSLDTEVKDRPHSFSCFIIFSVGLPASLTPSCSSSLTLYWPIPHIYLQRMALRGAAVNAVGI